jgi:hypothetical protein
MCEEHFVESYRATGSSDMGFCRANQRDRITLVDQHAATDRQIAGSGSGKLAGVSLDELDFGVAGGARCDDGGRVAIDGNDRAGRAHHQEKRVISVASTSTRDDTDPRR